MNLSQMKLQELDSEQMININGGFVWMALGLPGAVWASAFAIGYTAHYIYDHVQ